MDAPTQDQALEEAQRRLYALNVGDLDSIYYDDIQSFPARGIGGFAVAAVAGQLPFVQLFSPANSGFDIELVDVAISSPTAQTCDLRVNAAAIGAAGTELNRRDLRSSRGPGGEVRQGTEAVASGLVIARYLASTTQTLIVPLDMLCAPGTGIHIEGETVNTALRVTFRWRTWSPSRFSRS